LAAAPVVSCYEAGRDGFWLHCFLVAQGITNHVVDSASIEVTRRGRRAKTDRLDLGKLLAQLVRYAAGERKVWRVVQVPPEQAEDRRQVPRELLTLKRDRARVTNRIKGLLATPGVAVELVPGGAPEWSPVRRWDGRPCPQRRRRGWSGGGPRWSS
jgi:transposase